MNEITRWSATQIAEKIRQRKVSVTEVVQAHLQQIEARNPTLNALTEIDQSCLQLAAEMDAGTHSDARPALFGVPVTTKINVDQQGFANSNGVPAFAAQRCDKDSPVVANLKRSGAVIVGRSNTPEFSMRWFTSNPLHGVSLNPWLSDATPGGSSGAAAAAVATGMCAIAHGNDLGGSLRYPAFCCGVATLKPSTGRVPAYNPGAAAERPAISQSMSVQGPIARSIADVRLGFQAMSQANTTDPQWSGKPGSGREHSERLRVGYCHNPYTGDLDPALDSAMQIAVAGLRDSGAELIEIEPPDAEGCATLWGRLLFTEASVLMGESMRENGSDAMTQLLNSYENCFELFDFDSLLHAMTERVGRQRQWSALFDTVDLFLMPTSLQRPFANDLDFREPESVPAIVQAQKPLYTVNLLGLPAAAIPTHLADGLPVGVQLIGARNDDEFVLDSAERLEREIGTIIDQLATD